MAEQSVILKELELEKLNSLSLKLKKQRSICSEEIWECSNIRNFFKDLKEKFSIFFKNPIVLIWSFWWALTSCGMNQVFSIKL